MLQSCFVVSVIHQQYSIFQVQIQVLFRDFVNLV